MFQLNLILGLDRFTMRAEATLSRYELACEELLFADVTPFPLWMGIL